MALNYNLSKVYALSADDEEFVIQIITLFVNEVPEDWKFVKKGLEDLDYQMAYSFAHKIKPTLDLLGLDIAFEEIKQFEEWTKRKGKRSEVKELVKSIETQIEKAVKEIHKDFKL